MKGFFDRFDWGRFIQFSVPYAIGMKIFGPNWTWPTAISAGVLFGLFMAFFMGRKLEEEEKNQHPIPESLRVEHDPMVRLMYTAFFGVGVLGGFVLGTVALFAQQIDPKTPAEFPATFYALFFYGLSVFCYLASLNIHYSSTIGSRGIQKREKQIFGVSEEFVSFQEIKTVEVNMWGALLIEKKDGELFKLPIPMGADYSYFDGMDVPVSEMANPNFAGVYQIKKEILRRIQEHDLNQLAA